MPIMRIGNTTFRVFRIPRAVAVFEAIDSKEIACDEGLAGLATMRRLDHGAMGLGLCFSGRRQELFAYS